MIEEQSANAYAPEGAPAGDWSPEPERWRLRRALGVRALEEWTHILAQTHLRFDGCSTQRTPSTFHGAVTRRRFGEVALVDCALRPGRRRIHTRQPRPAEVVSAGIVREAGDPHIEPGRIG